MKLLAIDTSTDTLAFGISEDEKILFAQSVLLERRHSTDLLPILDRTLQKLRLTIGEMDGFIVGLGPGSFTGLRVGISMVKGMAAGLGKPVVGVPTLDCLAEAVPENGIPIVPFVDAKKQKVYAALYEKRKGALHKKIRERVTPPEPFLKRLSGKTLFLGSGVSLYRPLIQRRLGSEAVFADSAYDSPQPDALLKLGLARFAEKRFENLSTLTPLYLYPKDCMIKK